jgi:hypothetical protein
VESSPGSKMALCPRMNEKNLASRVIARVDSPAFESSSALLQVTNAKSLSDQQHLAEESRGVLESEKKRIVAPSPGFEGALRCCK